jgi:hypothetical protein
MVKAIHFICEPGAPYPKNVSPVDGKDYFRSGYWAISAELASDLMYGWLYMHKTKNDASHYGGKILGFEEKHCPEYKRSERIIFLFKPSVYAKQQIWRGDQYGRAWTGRLADTNFPHEILAGAISGLVKN